MLIVVNLRPVEESCVKDTTNWHSRLWFCNVDAPDWGKMRPRWLSRVLPVTISPISCRLKLN